MKISLVTTVLNEENSIKTFLDSVLKQNRLPDELVIVDGGSSDRTVANIKYKILNIKYKTRFKIIVKKGNRSVGRNEAIKRSTGSIIAVSDGGCILDKNWLKSITKPFRNKGIDVVAGYYKGAARSVFQKCLIPYVLVMPDKVDPKTFLPAARSMAMRKSVWKKIGGFPEKYSHNEDYVFSNILKRARVKIVFAKDAIVYWLPRNSLSRSFVMFFRFAYGDAEAQIIRSKVLLLFARYFFGLILLSLYFMTKSNFWLLAISYLLLAYLAWSVWKNYQYVKHPKAFLYLPLLQIVSDAAVLSGMTIGFLKRLMR